MLSHDFLAHKLQDPAGFLHWFHTVLRIQRPDVICAPRPLSAGPEALANVQEDLLQALRLDAKIPRAFAIFVDEAGYMVSMHRMMVVTYLFGNVEMPRDGLIVLSLCMYVYTGTLDSCKLPYGPCVCVQAGAHVSKQNRQQASQAVSCFLELIRAEFRDRKRRYMVHSIVLFGVDSLKRLLGCHRQLWLGSRFALRSGRVPAMLAPGQALCQHSVVQMICKTPDTS